MGSAESTGRTDATDDESRRENDSSGEGSSGTGKAVAVAAIGTAVVAWGISRMLSGTTDTESQEKDDRMKIKAPGMEPYLPNLGTTSYVVHESTHLSSPAVTWSLPPLDRYKMNTDGASRGNPGPSGYGGILRDCRGQWVRGFRGSIGKSDCLTAEFHGILQGLELLDKLGLKESILESDSTAAVDWIKKEVSFYRGSSQIIRDCWPMIMDCRHLISKNRITILDITNDANKCADKLANMAIDDGQGYIEVINLPDEIKHIVYRERSISWS